MTKLYFCQFLDHYEFNHAIYFLGFMVTKIWSLGFWKWPSKPEFEYLPIFLVEDANCGHLAWSVAFLMFLNIIRKWDFIMSCKILTKYEKFSLSRYTLFQHNSSHQKYAASEAIVLWLWYSIRSITEVTSTIKNWPDYDRTDIEKPFLLIRI